MKSKNKTKKGKEINLSEKFIAFGNKKKVFGLITLATVILTIIGIPTILKEEKILKYFLIIWILQVIYIWLYLASKKKK